MMFGEGLDLPISDTDRILGSSLDNAISQIEANKRMKHLSSETTMVCSSLETGTKNFEPARSLAAIRNKRGLSPLASSTFSVESHQAKDSSRWCVQCTRVDANAASKYYTHWTGGMFVSLERPPNGSAPFYYWSWNHMLSHRYRTPSCTEVEQDEALKDLRSYCDDPGKLETFARRIGYM
ncbi:hypothetical protein PRIPAC_94594 [Pristionchus pacificus]|uniref:Uncharacterized protein n=1 Tax=Pristionchus pacificus TaxID=54126 RepID=A0A2A6BQC1_PRIPA|nr:hypothetical protein PRIPAC_94594 [Pristionchus pacificus]|eukprot:PDM68114.1 hypothetical protein PRIPAC_46158 [Pristionchus pacificus]